MATMAVDTLVRFIHGRASKPVTWGNGLVIGEGEVVPELNFTLPPADINADTWSEVREQYEVMISSTLERAEDLKAPSLLLEFETLPPMTIRPLVRISSVWWPIQRSIIRWSTPFEARLEAQECRRT